MLASVLRTSVASSVSVDIMRAFVVMRSYISNNLIEQKYINELVLKNSKRIDLLEDTFNGFKERFCYTLWLIKVSTFNILAKRLNCFD